MRLLVVVAIIVGLVALAEQNVLPNDAVHDHAWLRSAVDGVKVVHSDAWLERRKVYIQGTADWQPRHVHLALGHSPDEMVVTWSTLNLTLESVVEYGEDLFNLDLAGTGTTLKFVDQGSKHSTQYIHRVHLTNLKPNTTYYYHAGSSNGWSSVFGFRTVPPQGEAWPLKLAVLGDMGAINARVLKTLQQDAHRGMYHAVIHVGDFAYDMYEEDGNVGDIFMEQIQPVAGYLPYMTCPGNHEATYDFLHYRNRFSMPNYAETSNLHFSFNVGPVHFVSISTEVYFYDDIVERVKSQYDWLVEDLKAATQPETRALRPWIVMFGHRPMYCSNVGANNCLVSSMIRAGLPPSKSAIPYALEPLLKQYGVDLFLSGHQHSYERIYPIYNYTMAKGSEERPYFNPGAPTHIITGSAGCREDLTDFLPTQPLWSAKRLDEYGFTRITFLNHTHMTMHQVSDESEEVQDEILLVREEHGPF